MTTPRSPRPSGAAGVRHLLTAASLAATLSGWALFTAAQPPQASATLLATAAAVAAPPPAWLSAPPLPTLVTVATAAVPVAPVAAPSAPVAAPLREASALPPAPITTTRSSR